MSFKNNLPINIIIVLLSVNLVFFIYFFNFHNTVFHNDGFYKKEFNKYGVYNKFINKNVDEINKNVLSYLKSEKDIGLISKDFFNEKEKKHLLDVKNVFNKVYFFNRILIIYSIFLILILCCLLLKKLLIKKNYYYKNIFDKKILKEFLKKILLVFIIGSSLTIMSMAILFVMVKINFNFTFDIIHKSFFEKGSWLFESSSNIINLYPIGFFYDVIRTILLKVFFMSILIFFMAFVFFFWRIDD